MKKNTWLLRHFMLLCWIVVSMLLILLACGCTKKVYVPVETVTENVVYRTDTLRQVVQRYDSIYIRDSVSLIHRNDTVFLTKWRDQLKYIYRTDTLYNTKADSIYAYIEKPVPYEVEKIVKVEKPLKWWQKTLMWMGVVAIIAIGYLIYRLVKRYKP